LVLALAARVFFPDTPVFLPPQKINISNLNWNSRVTGFSVEDCYVLPSLKKANLFNFSFFYFETCAKVLEEQ